MVLFSLSSFSLSPLIFVFHIGSFKNVLCFWFYACIWKWKFSNFQVENEGGEWIDLLTLVNTVNSVGELSLWLGLSRHFFLELGNFPRQTFSSLLWGQGKDDVEENVMLAWLPGFWESGKGGMGSYFNMHFYPLFLSWCFTLMHPYVWHLWAHSFLDSKYFHSNLPSCRVAEM